LRRWTLFFTRLACAALRDGRRMRLKRLRRRWIRACLLTVLIRAMMLRLGLRDLRRRRRRIFFFMRLAAAACLRIVFRRLRIGFILGERRRRICFFMRLLAAACLRIVFMLRLPLRLHRKMRQRQERATHTRRNQLHFWFEAFFLLILQYLLYLPLPLQ